MPPRSWIACLALVLPLAPAAAKPYKSAQSPQPSAEVKIEVRFFSVMDDGFDRVGIDFNGSGEPVRIDTGRLRKYLDDAFRDGGKKPLALKDRQVREFLSQVRADPRTKVLAAPVLKAADGKTVVSCTGGSRTYLTGVNVGQVGGSIVLLGKREPIDTGMSLTVRPNLAADRHSVRLQLKASLTAEKDNPKQIPVEIRITPPAKDGQAAKTLTFQRDLQQPQLLRLEMEKELTIPNGGTVLLGALRKHKQTRREVAVPVLANVPYVGRLFRNIGYAQETENVLVMVTANIVPAEDAKTAAALEKRLDRVVKRFLDEARQVVRQVRP